MMIIETDEIVGYDFTADGVGWTGGIICLECVSEEAAANATADQIITKDILERYEDDGKAVYCDECNHRLPVESEPEPKKELRRRWWLNLGLWDNNSGNEECDKLSKAVGERMLSEIKGVEYSTGDSAGLVFKTWDKAEAEAVRDKAIKIMREVWPDCGQPEEAFDINPQPQCPKCEKLAKWSAKHCENCGAELV